MILQALSKTGKVLIGAAAIGAAAYGTKKMIDCGRNSMAEQEVRDAVNNTDTTSAPTTMPTLAHSKKK